MRIRHYLSGPPREIPGIRPPTREEILVFDFSLNPGTARVNDLLLHLDDGERERANRFATPELRERFIVAHGETRKILAGLLGLAPAGPRFSHAPGGKPFLPECAAHGWEFNLTHASDRALLAVANGRRVGVDLERLRPMPDALDIAKRTFHPLEIQELHREPPGRIATAFLRTWTRKESYVKAVGGGLSMPLSDFHAVDEVGEYQRWIMDGALADGVGWFVGDLAVGEDHVAAVTFSDR